jgi:hypothetical protein
MPDLLELHQPFATDFGPKKILLSEIIRAKPSLRALGIGFSLSHATKRIRAGKAKKAPYFACCYNVGETWGTSISLPFTIRSLPIGSSWKGMLRRTECASALASEKR